jgi:hypothetical protein
VNLASVAVQHPAKVAGWILRAASRGPWLAAAGLGVAACLTAEVVGARRTASQGRNPNWQSAPGSAGTAAFAHHGQRRPACAASRQPRPAARHVFVPDEW